MGYREGSRAMPERKLLSEKEYKEKITRILANIHSAVLLKRIYQYIQHVYIYN